MENKTITAEAAFPLISSDGMLVNHGLTKREYFAGLAMQGMLSIPNTGLTCDGITKRAVQAADSLLKALEE